MHTPGPPGGLPPGQSLWHLSYAASVIVGSVTAYHTWLTFRGDPVALALSFAALAAAAAVVRRPASLGPISVLNAVLVAKYADQAPDLVNHHALTWFVSLTMLVLYAPALAGGRAGDRSGLWDRTRAVLAAELVLTYFFVVFHKLNHDFLDPAVSCGAAMYGHVNARWGGLLPENAAAGYAAIAGTLAAEASIPALLIVPRTRRAGLAVGFVFHGLLMMHPVEGIMGYSSLTYALYTLFLPGGAAGWLMGYWGRRGRAVVAAAAAAGVAWAVIVVARAAEAGPVGGEALTDSLHRDSWVVLRAGWWAFHLWFAWAVVRALAAAGPGAEDRVFRARAFATPAAAVLPLMAVNATAPYHGLYSNHSWSMYSNLKVEGAETNHLLVPASARLFPNVGDTWLVRDCSSREVLGRAAGGRQQTLDDIRRRLNRTADPGRFIELARPGEPFRRVEYRAEPDHPVFRPLPLWQRKVLNSRAVPQDGKPCPCIH